MARIQFQLLFTLVTTPFVLSKYSIYYTIPLTGFYYTLGPECIAAFFTVVGFIICFGGYKLLRPTAVVCGFLLGSLACDLLVWELFRKQFFLHWIAFFLGGGILGYLFQKYWYFTIFSIGLTAGLFLGIYLNTTLIYVNKFPHNKYFLWITVTTFGILIGILSLRFKRPILLVSTSLIGSIGSTWGYGYYIGKYYSIFIITKADIKFRNSGKYWFYYFILTYILFFVGLIIQWRLDLISSSSTLLKQQQQYDFDDCTTPDDNKIQIKTLDEVI